MLYQAILYYPRIGAPWKEITIQDDLIIEQWIVPKGSIIKTKQTRDFGWVLLPNMIKDKRGFEIPKRIFKY